MLEQLRRLISQYRNEQAFLINSRDMVQSQGRKDRDNKLTELYIISINQAGNMGEEIQKLGEFIHNLEKLETAALAEISGRLARLA